MNKLFALIFSTLILVQCLNISFEDISKLNVLLEHAEYHHDMYGDNFFEFLTEHYGADMMQHQNDHKQHQNLPFKHHKDCTHIVFDFTIGPQFHLDNSQQSFTEFPFNFFYKESSSSFEKRSVFQPPKLA